jgi:hypothetical protein
MAGEVNVDFMQRRWYAVVNDLVGGWAVATADQPVHALRLPPHGEDYLVADMLTEKAAQHVRDLHNASLRLGNVLEELDTADGPPSQMLRAAAKRLREVAAGTTPGDWSYRLLAQHNVYWVDATQRDDGGTTFAVAAEAGRRGDARWIVTMSPALAQALATTLEDTAAVIAWATRWDEVSDAGQQARIIATRILGVT